MGEREPLEARCDQVRNHDLRLAILALAAQGKPMDPEDLRRELPAHPKVALIEYHCRFSSRFTYCRLQLDR